ncbi:MAG: helix-turn-helix domain-containing protein [Xanthomonadales bacterium]|jgi:cytoskeleton protein RodZ|nr:helix-turn-helix domain-containing protein [Xanthomonadales bacterium]
MTEQPSLWPLDACTDLIHLREARGWSVADVATRLRCQPRIIEALESGEAGGLAPVYRKGFLKRYLALLEVDQESEARLLAQLDVTPAPVKTVFETQPRVQSTERWLRVASYLLASLLVGTLAWQIAHEAARMAPVEVSDNRELAPVPGPIPAVDGGPVNASMGGLESLHAPGGSRTADAGARAWEALNATRRTQAALAGGEHLLELETSADSWVEVFDGDERLEQDLVRGGERRAYRGTGPFRISLGRASAVRLTLDGEAVALEPFTREDVARLLLEPALAPAPDANGSPSAQSRVDAAQQEAAPES